MRSIREIFPRLRAVILVPGAAAAAVMAVTPAPGAERALNSAGVLHIVRVEYQGSPGPSPKSSRLVHTQRASDENLQTVVIPGTEDANLDLDPSIAISPLTGFPMVVWSRATGGNFEVFTSFYESTGWIPSRALTLNSFDDRNPQVAWGASGYVHLIWRGSAQPDGSPELFEAVLDVKGRVMRGPAPLRLAPSGTVTTTSGCAFVLRADDLILSIDSSSKVDTRVSAYGGIDEPVPVARRVDFVVPAAYGPIAWSKVEIVNGTAVVLLRAGVRLFYSYQLSGGWLPLKSVLLDTISEEGAEILIRNATPSASAP